MGDQALESDDQCTKNAEAIYLQRHGSLMIIQDTPKGRSVFAKEPLPSGTIIETCPALIFPLDDLNLLKSTLLDHYSYNWPVKDPETGRIKITQALSLGLGSIFNHSDHQNVGFQRDLESKTIVYKPLREVLAGEELCISDASHLWFDNADGENGKAKDIEKESSLLEAVQLYSHSSDSLS